MKIENSASLITKLASENRLRYYQGRVGYCCAMLPYNLNLRYKSNIKTLQNIPPT